MKLSINFRTLAITAAILGLIIIGFVLVTAGFPPIGLPIVLPLTAMVPLIRTKSKVKHIYY